jgi:hypothetical protein
VLETEPEIRGGTVSASFSNFSALNNDDKLITVTAGLVLNRHLISQRRLSQTRHLAACVKFKSDKHGLHMSLLPNEVKWSSLHAVAQSLVRCSQSAVHLCDRSMCQPPSDDSAYV